MQLRGIVRAASLEEYPPGGDRVEMVLKVQGVGAGQPRTIIIPFELLLRDQDLEPDAVLGHAFQAEAVEDGPGRWLVTTIAFAQGRILRHPD
ncbi:MAG TPA: hypothetical protein VF590_23470 [Isosphaeraceae bacterium]|jgi:hypothetical protein